MIAAPLSPFVLQSNSDLCLQSCGECLAIAVATARCKGDRPGIAGRGDLDWVHPADSLSQAFGILDWCCIHPRDDHRTTLRRTGSIRLWVA